MSYSHLWTPCICSNCIQPNVFFCLKSLLTRSGTAWIDITIAAYFLNHFNCFSDQQSLLIFFSSASPLLSLCQPHSFQVQQNLHNTCTKLAATPKENSPWLPQWFSKFWDRLWCSGTLCTPFEWCLLKRESFELGFEVRGGGEIWQADRLLVELFILTRHFKKRKWKEKIYWLVWYGYFCFSLNFQFPVTFMCIQSNMYILHRQLTVCVHDTYSISLLPQFCFPFCNFTVVA